MCVHFSTGTWPLTRLEIVRRSLALFLLVHCAANMGSSAISAQETIINTFLVDHRSEFECILLNCCPASAIMKLMGCRPIAADMINGLNGMCIIGLARLINLQMM